MLILHRCIAIVAYLEVKLLAQINGNILPFQSIDLVLSIMFLFLFRRVVRRKVTIVISATVTTV
jgi:hypothetical protein